MAEYEFYSITKKQEIIIYFIAIFLGMSIGIFGISFPFMQLIKDMVSHKYVGIVFMLLMFLSSILLSILLLKILIKMCKRKIFIKANFDKMWITIDGREKYFLTKSIEKLYFLNENLSHKKAIVISLHLRNEELNFRTGCGWARPIGTEEDYNEAYDFLDDFLDAHEHEFEVEKEYFNSDALLFKRKYTAR